MFFTAGCYATVPKRSSNAVAPAVSATVSPGLIMTRPSEISWEVSEQAVIGTGRYKSSEIPDADEDGVSLSLANAKTFDGVGFHDMPIPVQLAVTDLLTEQSADGIIVTSYSITELDDPDSEYSEIYDVVVRGYPMRVKPIGAISAERMDAHLTQTVPLTPETLQGEGAASGAKSGRKGGRADDF